MRISGTGCAVIGVLLVAAGIHAFSWAACQHRSVYPGELIFIGASKYIYGTEYWRVYLWRERNEQAPLPDATIHIRGHAYPLSELTPETLQAHGGGGGADGAIVDGHGTSLLYRFENGKLTRLTLDAEMRQRNKEPVPALEDSFAISIGDGPPFLFPLNHRELKRLGGKPARRQLFFSQ